MLISLQKPIYQDHIGHLRFSDGNMLWTVFVTTGAIEKLAHAAADDETLLAAAGDLLEIAHGKLAAGQALSASIWIRSLDIHERH